MRIFNIFQSKEARPPYEALSDRDRRRYLEELSSVGKFDKIGELPGFQIIDKNAPSNGADGISDCIDYAFGGLERMKVMTPKEISQTEVESGDAVIYLDKDNHPVHAGRITMFPAVRSKFGAGYVYEHPVAEVPSSYWPENGSVKFYRIRGE